MPPEARVGGTPMLKRAVCICIYKTEIVKRGGGGWERMKYTHIHVHVLGGGGG